MIDRLTKKGTIRLLAAIRRQALMDVRRYGRKSNDSHKGNYVSTPCLESAEYYLDVELPVIREVLGECFKD
jgi:hypothetical protein